MVLVDVIKTIKYILLRHLAEVEEGYFTHMKHSLYYAGLFLLLTVTSIIHSILPFLFVNTGSTQIRKLYNNMRKRLADICP
jgi:hypothetical protein